MCHLTLESARCLYGHIRADASNANVDIDVHADADSDAALGSAVDVEMHVTSSAKSTLVF